MVPGSEGSGEATKRDEGAIPAQHSLRTHPSDVCPSARRNVERRDRCQCTQRPGRAPWKCCSTCLELDSQ